MKNIEIRLNYRLLKKAVLGGLACVTALGVLTIDQMTVKASVGKTLPTSVQVNTRAVLQTTSAPRRITFNVSTIEIDKYSSYSVTRFMNVLPTIENTSPDLKGIKYWTGNPNIAYVSGNSIIAKSEGRTWLYVETPNKVRAKVSVLVKAPSYYPTATSDPKKLYFTESTIKIAKFESVYAPRALTVVPKVPNTVPFLKGTKYWTGNPNIAYVSGDSVIAKSEGRTWLYVETPNKVKAKVSILVTPQKDYSRVSFVDKVTKLGLNQNFNVNDFVFPTLTSSDVSTVVKPNIKYTYRIGNSKLAKVSANGIVQALAKGRTWLYVKSESGYENRISLNIVDTQKKATSVTLPSTQTIKKKEKIKLKAVVSPANSKVASWRIGNSKVATINQSGIVTGVSVGNTYAYAKLANGKEVRCLIKVQNPAKLSVQEYYNNSNIVYDGGSIIINKDETQLSVYRDDDKLINAKTGNSAIARVSTTENGIVSIKAITNGNTWLHLETEDGLKCKVLLKVKKAPLTKFYIPDKFIVDKNGSQYLYGELDIDDEYRNAVKFRTGNSKVAKVSDDGYLIGISEGLTYLYAECKGKTLKSLVSVKNGPAIKSIKFDKSVVSINAKVNKTSSMPKVTFNPGNAVNQRLAFKTGNSKIAEVDWTGTIIGKSNGNTYVYATAPNGVTTKMLVKVSGFDEIKQINAPRTIDINLSENTPGDKDYNWKNYDCTATLNTAYGNKLEDVEVFIGNKSIVEVKYVNINGSKIYVQYIPKSQGNTYLNFKMPNGKIVKTLIKVHW